MRQATEVCASTAKSALAVGADGVMIEIHPEPEKAVSDGAQSLKPERFYEFMDQIRTMENVMKEVTGGRR